MGKKTSPKEEKREQANSLTLTQFLSSIKEKTSET